MRIPAIRGTIGNWRYYVGIMSFAQVNQNIIPSINALFKTKKLCEKLQRDLTSNSDAIKNYILTQKDQRFFNALVLAIYDGNPRWHEAEFDDEGKTKNVGFLQFTIKIEGGSEVGINEIIFPIDGQHRVQGIIDALKINPELASEFIPVIFVAHEDNDNGRIRSRRLFSTLNRKAKPVGGNFKIALDEDSVVAHITRELLETHILFSDDKIKFTANKSMSKTDKEFSSIIALNECNEMIVKHFLPKEKRKNFKKYLENRPPDTEIDVLYSKAELFWNDFYSCTPILEKYTELKDAKTNFRELGDILFRPVIFTAYILAALRIHEGTGKTFKEIFTKLNELKRNLNEFPWLGYIWDGKKMVLRASRNQISNILIYQYDRNYFSEDEIKKILEDYKLIANYQDSDKKLIEDFK